MRYDMNMRNSRKINPIFRRKKMNEDENITTVEAPRNSIKGG
jgi:hypothetical protein